MEIFYTLHAEDQIKERKIEKIWIEEAIKSPDLIRRSGIKYYAIKRTPWRMLKVVYVKEKYIKVITVYYVK